MKKVFSLLLVLMLVLSIAVPGMAAGKTKTKITLDKKGTVTINMGETLALHATVTPAATVAWKSNKESVAEVDFNGVVLGNKPGTATITAKAGGKTAKVKVKVVDPYKPTGLTIAQGKKVTLDIDKTLPLTIAFKPDTAFSDLTFKTSKKSVATVENGVVKPKKEGTAKITVTSTKNKKAKATITVKVVDPYKPTKVVINQGKKQTLTAGSSLQLTTTLTPSTARNDLTYKSSKKSVATVDANGKVTAVKKGTAKITVTSKSNKKAKATITIKVNKAAGGAPDVSAYIGQKASAVNKTLKLKVNTKDWKTTVLEGDGFILRTNGSGSNLDKLTIAGVSLYKANGHNYKGLSVGMKFADVNAKLEAMGWDVPSAEYDEEVYGDNGDAVVGYRREYWREDGAYQMFSVERNKSGAVTELSYWNNGI